MAVVGLEPWGAEATVPDHDLHLTERPQVGCGQRAQTEEQQVTVTHPACEGPAASRRSRAEIGEPRG